MCGYRLRVKPDRLEEGLLSLRLVSAGELKRAERPVAAALVRILLDALFNLGDRLIQVLQAGRGVPEQDMGIQTRRLHLQCLFCPGLGVVVSSGQQQHGPGLELHVRAIGQQVRRADVLAQGVWKVIQPRVDLGQLVPRVAETRVLLNRVSILDDRFVELPLLHIGISAGEIFALEGLRVARTANGEQEHQPCRASKR